MFCITRPEASARGDSIDRQHNRLSTLLNSLTARFQTSSVNRARSGPARADMRGVRCDRRSGALILKQSSHNADSGVEALDTFQLTHSALDSRSFDTSQTPLQGGFSTTDTHASVRSTSQKRSLLTQKRSLFDPLLTRGRSPPVRRFHDTTRVDCDACLRRAVRRASGGYQGV